MSDTAASTPSTKNREQPEKRKKHERTQEEARALDRAKTVSRWMATVSNPEMALWTLSLGQYGKACKEQEDTDSSFERPVIFAGVRSSRLLKNPVTDSAMRI
jgi:hypothetical protein